MSKMTKQQAGQLGGQKTYQLYGSVYMSEIGKRGALAFWTKYEVVPHGTSSWLLVSRTDQKIIGVWQGRW